MAAGGDLINFVKQYNQAGHAGQGHPRRRPDVHHRHPLARCRAVLRTPSSPTRGTGTSTTKNSAWADKFTEKTNTRPSFAHAGNYSAALQYLEAIQAAGTDDADAVVKKLEGKKLNDVFLRNGEIRAADHRVLHDAYLAKVKTKDQVKEDWDYEEIVTTIPAAEAFDPRLGRLQDVT